MKRIALESQVKQAKAVTAEEYEEQLKELRQKLEESTQNREAPKELAKSQSVASLKSQGQDALLIEDLRRELREQAELHEKELALIDKQRAKEREAMTEDEKIKLLEEIEGLKQKVDELTQGLEVKTNELEQGKAQHEEKVRLLI